MSILFRIAFSVDTKSYPEYYEQQRLERETSRSHTSKIDQHRAGAIDREQGSCREGLVHLIPVLTPEYLLLSRWVLPLRYPFTLHRNVAQLRPVTEIAPKPPFLCEQKPYPVLLSCRRQSYPDIVRTIAGFHKQSPLLTMCEHSLNL